jgi:hypothetical protein
MAEGEDMEAVEEDTASVVAVADAALAVAVAEGDAALMAALRVLADPPRPVSPVPLLFLRTPPTLFETTGL